MAVSANPHTASARIEVINLRKTFRRDDGRTITPVDDVTLSVADSEIMVLLGPSGCGKTTLLRCVAGLERPDSGTIVIDDKVVFCSERRIFVPAERREISMIFQSFALWPHMTVADNVAYPLRCRQVPAPEIRTRVGNVLDLVNIGHLARQYPSRISGGQQQRVALARALVSESRVILFDEPLSNVDAQVRAQLRFEIKRLQREIGFSTMYVTHDQLEALELGHRMAVMRDGSVSALDLPRSVYQHPNNAYVAAFVGAANIWEGRIVRVSDETLDVAVGSQHLTVPKRGDHTAGLQPDDKVTLVIRPENVLVHGEGKGEPGPNAFTAELQMKMFSGPYVECVASKGDLSIRAWPRLADVEHLNRSDTVRIQIPIDSIHLIPMA